ncbi:MAG: 16S rRNA (cytosine(967)-C(5))-methyltransferase RsmB [Candidatus Hydrogenedentes bacterium]|nr:16S rRNA (cytosine(967)-C(5))-methyltransferase RsmB [Candidatus Hydrogenedentota bacterium]
MTQVDLVRAGVINTLLRWEDTKLPIDECISKTLKRKGFSTKGRRFFANLIYGTLRNLYFLDYIISKYSFKPLETLPKPIQYILRIAVYQLFFCTQVTRPASVHTSVELARAFGHIGLAKLVNAILRNIPEKLEEIPLPNREEDEYQFLSIKYSIPVWILREYEKNFGKKTLEEFCIATTEVPFMAVRTNTTLISREELQKRLSKIGIETQHLTPIPEELSLPPTYLLIECPLFKQGLYTIQDPASMMCGHALQPKPYEKIADICSAPGTKATHIAELTSSTAKVYALDINSKRILRIKENIRRLKLKNIFTLVADGTSLPFQDETFDKVILDAPCSGLGTIRRNPDLKYNASKESVIRLAILQKKLLGEAIRICRKGGIIVYSVCTFTEEETRKVVESFINHNKVLPIDGPELLEQWKIGTGTYQTLPTKNLLDGFFLTILQKL